MIDIIDKISELYRTEQGKVVAMSQERLSIEMSLIDAEKTHYENITVAEHQYLTMRKSVLDDQIELKNLYCQGIHDTRELLMDMVSSFNVEITTQN